MCPEPITRDRVKCGCVLSSHCALGGNEHLLGARTKRVWVAGGKNFLWRFIGWAVLACLLGRALKPTLGDLEMTDRVVMSDQASSESPEENDTNHTQHMPSPESYVVDPSVRRDQRIPASIALILWFSGLRGAVAYACAKMFPYSFGIREHFIWTTMAIVLVTVYLFGGTTELVLGWLKIDTGIDEESYIEARKHGEDEITGLVQNLGKSTDGIDDGETN